MTTEFETKTDVAEVEATIVDSDAKDTEEKDLSMFDVLITEEVDFQVEKRGLHTYGEDGGMHMPNHTATIRINPDGTEMPLWVVGSRYEVVDHRDVIRQFAHILDKADIEGEVSHKVFLNGCRIYSKFTLNEDFNIEGSTEKAKPFFTLTTSHDGSLKVGFLIGAKVGKRYFLLSQKLYGAWAKHTKGINIDKTLEDIHNALKLFVNDVLPVWARMHSIVLDATKIRNVIEKAVKDKVITKHRAKDLLATEDTQNLWEVFTQVIDEVSEVRGKRGTEEGAFTRNTKVNEYFRQITVRMEEESSEDTE